MVPNTKNGRLSSKALHDKKELSDLQTAIFESVGKRYGLMRGKEGSRAKYLSTAEYKAKKIIEQAQEQTKVEMARVKLKAQAELTEITQAIKKSEGHFDDTMQKVEAAKAERKKVVAERNAEADYSKALSDAKNGELSRSKHGCAALVAENKRLTEINRRLVRDNADLFNQVQGNNRDNSRFSAATKAISLFRTHEPEAFTRGYRPHTFHQHFLILNMSLSPSISLSSQLSRQ